MTSDYRSWVLANWFVVHKYGRTKKPKWKPSNPCKRCGTRRRLRNGNWEYWNKTERRWQSHNPRCAKKPGR